MKSTKQVRDSVVLLGEALDSSWISGILRFMQVVIVPFPLFLVVLFLFSSLGLGANSRCQSVTLLIITYDFVGRGIYLIKLIKAVGLLFYSSLSVVLY